MRKTSILLAVLLSGCASTGVVSADKGAYLISKASPQVGFGPPVEIKGEVYAEANDFCAKTGRSVETISLDQVNSGFGRRASVSLEFRCVQ
jgi:hypothetical protein